MCSVKFKACHAVAMFTIFLFSVYFNQSIVYNIFLAYIYDYYC